MFTREQIQAMAPDASSLKSANGLASDSKWVSMGANTQALWGECKGSGSKPYQTQIELSSVTSRCSCPSRKFPCKHALALLLLYAQQAPRIASTSEEPQWVTEWLTSRQQRAAKKEEKAAAAKTIDPAKQAANAAKRQNTRWKKMTGGAQELQRWLTDQFQRGFASFEHTQSKDWQGMAARMVDAQAPGLGRYLQNALQTMRGGNKEQQNAIEQLGLLQLLVSAALRKDELTPNQQADIQTAMGWSWDKDDVLASAPSVTDNWLVLGQKMQELDSRLTERRTWLWGQNTRQYALLLDFAFQRQGLEWVWDNNQAYNTTLAYYPGSIPLRALAVQPPTKSEQANNPTHHAQWPETSSSQSLEQASKMLATNPWLHQVPVLLPQTRLLLQDTQWLAHTPEGYFLLDINGQPAWALMAYACGQAITLFAEWNGRQLCPISARAQHHPNETWVNVIHA